MQHVSDDDLVLHLYGEVTSPHIDGCAECRERYQALQRDMNVVDLPVPQRGSEYESEVWVRLEPKLGRRPSRWTFVVGRWAAAAAMACVIAVAFMAGRYAPPVQDVTEDAVAANRVLSLAVREHLEQSQIALTELVHHDTNVAAAPLLTANRVYRMSAIGAGDQAMAALLEDLERLLVEATNSPETLDRRDLKDVLLRVRVAALHLKRDTI